MWVAINALLRSDECSWCPLSESNRPPTELRGKIGAGMESRTPRSSDWKSAVRPLHCMPAYVELSSTSLRVQTIYFSFTVLDAGDGTASSHYTILKHTEHGFATHMFSAPHDQVSVYRVALWVCFNMVFLPSAVKPTLGTSQHIFATLIVTSNPVSFGSSDTNHIETHLVGFEPTNGPESGNPCLTTKRQMCFNMVYQPHTESNRKVLSKDCVHA